MANTADFEAELPRGSFGNLIAPRATPQGAPANQQDLAVRKSAFRRFFESPEGIAASLQLLIGATRNPGFGESTGSVLGQSLGEAGQAVARVQETRRATEQQEFERGITERQVGAQETQAGAAAERVGLEERRVDLAEQQAGLNEEFRRDELAFRRDTQQQQTLLQQQLQELRRLEVAETQARTDIERDRLLTQIDQFERRIDSDSRALATRLAAEAQIAVTRSSLDVLAALTKAETERAFLEGTAPDTQGVLEQFRLFTGAAQQAGGITQPGQQAQGTEPVDPASVPPGVDPGLVQAIRQRGPDSVSAEEWAIILSDQRQTSIAVAAFGQQIVDQKRAELANQQQGATPVPAPAPASPGSTNNPIPRP